MYTYINGNKYIPIELENLIGKEIKNISILKIYGNDWIQFITSDNCFVIGHIQIVYGSFKLNNIDKLKLLENSTIKSFDVIENKDSIIYKIKSNKMDFEIKWNNASGHNINVLLFKVI